MAEKYLFEAPGEAVATAVAEALFRRGLRPMRSFDLRLALEAHHDCPCPYHGTEECTCQFIVLLVYGQGARPVVLTAHTVDRVTTIRLHTDDADDRVVEDVRLAIDETAAPQAAEAIRGDA